MGEIQVEPSRLQTHARDCSAAALVVGDLATSARLGRGTTGDANSTAALQALVTVVDSRASTLATVVGEVAAALGDAAAAYATVDGQG